MEIDKLNIYKNYAEVIVDLIKILDKEKTFVTDPMEKSFYKGIIRLFTSDNDDVDSKIDIFIDFIFVDLGRILKKIVDESANDTKSKKIIEDIYDLSRSMATFLISDYKKIIESYQPEMYLDVPFWIEHHKEETEKKYFIGGGSNSFTKPIQEYLIKQFNEILNNVKMSNSANEKKSSTKTYQDFLIDRNCDIFKPLHDAKLFDDKGIFKGYFDEVKNEVQTLIIVFREKGYFKKPILPSHNYLFANALKIKTDINDRTMRKDHWQPAIEMKEYYSTLIPAYSTKS